MPLSGRLVCEWTKGADWSSAVYAINVHSARDIMVCHYESLQNGMTPLNVAALHGDLEGVRLLLAAKAETGATNKVRLFDESRKKRQNTF